MAISLSTSMSARASFSFFISFCFVRFFCLFFCIIPCNLLFTPSFGIHIVVDVYCWFFFIHFIIANMCAYAHFSRNRKNHAKQIIFLCMSGRLTCSWFKKIFFVIDATAETNILKTKKGGKMFIYFQLVCTLGKLRFIFLYYLGGCFENTQISTKYHLKS